MVGVALAPGEASCDLCKVETKTCTLFRLRRAQYEGRVHDCSSFQSVTLRTAEKRSAPDAPAQDGLF